MNPERINRPLNTVTAALRVLPRSCSHVGRMNWIDVRLRLKPRKRPPINTGRHPFERLPCPRNNDSQRETAVRPRVVLSALCPWLHSDNPHGCRRVQDFSIVPRSYLPAQCWSPLRAPAGFPSPLKMWTLGSDAVELRPTMVSERLLKVLYIYIFVCVLAVCAISMYLCRIIAEKI